MGKVRLAVVAVGGNALISDKDHLAIADQYEQAAVTAHHIADMIEAGWNVIVTHGNGPQMGFILRRSELSIHEVAPVPMDYAGADLQGAIGYMFLKAFRNEFRRRGLQREPVAIVTETLVDRDDPAFREPTKPIGSHMDEARARELAAKQGWTVKEDAGRGWRRVVPSPAPKRIIDLDAIRELASAGYLVIACGGGGIPVVEDTEGNICGIEAVIDKDFASGLLARTVGADLFMVSTAVERVAINFNRPNQKWLDRITVAEARRYAAEDHFDKGSMGPKIQALIDYLDAGGTEGLITNPENIGRALAGQTGTRIVPADASSLPKIAAAGRDASS
jgi:carbamate kinase